jgi:acetyl esterase/lipase
VRYRLAPQYPFPAQLLDALISYLSLLSPPPGVPHGPVPAEHIVFGGDSAGANLATALLLLLLTLRRMGLTTIRYHGVDVPVELPAGVALNSPWVDVTRSLPSINKNAHFDYLDPPTDTGVSRHEPIPDAVWPTDPPRADIFCNASMMIHPLTSPLAAAAELWKGMPPVFICLGNEALEDEVLILARRMHQGGGVVELVGYEGMPHCFAMMFPTSASGSDCYQRWCDFYSEVVQGLEVPVSQAGWVKAFSKPLQLIKTPIEEVSNLSDQDVADAMAKMQQHAVAREMDAQQKWNERQTRARL